MPGLQPGDRKIRGDSLAAVSKSKSCERNTKIPGTERSELPVNRTAKPDPRERAYLKRLYLWLASPAATYRLNSADRLRATLRVVQRAPA